MRTITGMLGGLLAVMVAGLLLYACGPGPAGSMGAQVKLVLNWKPEPEFGGFYAAQTAGIYKKQKLTVEIVPGDTGVPSLDQVAAGRAEFGIASADEVVIAQERGKDVVALFAVYQTCPQAIMVHEESGLTSLAQVLERYKEGKLTLAVEKGLAYVQYLARKFKLDTGAIVPRGSGTAVFLAKKDMALQCFMFSEPLTVARAGARAKAFLIAAEGYNPYTAVVVTRKSYLDSNPGVVKAFLEAITRGWEVYLENPVPANEVMAKLNPFMPVEVMNQTAEVQKPLIVTAETKAHGLGVMTEERWDILVGQLKDLKIVSGAPKARDLFYTFPKN